MIRLLLDRRSTRKYTGQRVEREKIDKILTAALLAPSSRNRKPWEFIVVDDPDILRELSTAKAQGAAFLETAPLGIVIIADQSVSDMCIEDTSIAGALMQVQAERLGLGSCWIQIRQRVCREGGPAEDYVRKCLHIPEGYMVESILSVGYSDETLETRSLEDLPYDKVHYHYYGMKYPGRYR